LFPLQNGEKVRQIFTKLFSIHLDQEKLVSHMDKKWLAILKNKFKFNLISKNPLYKIRLY